jgi:outer membrane biosynthesis protein TonB
MQVCLPDGGITTTTGGSIEEHLADAQRIWDEFHARMAEAGAEAEAGGQMVGADLASPQPAEPEAVPVVTAETVPPPPEQPPGPASPPEPEQPPVPPVTAETVPPPEPEQPPVTQDVSVASLLQHIEAEAEHVMAEAGQMVSDLMGHPTPPSSGGSQT